MKSKISKEDEINKLLEIIKSLIKVWPFFIQAQASDDEIEIIKDDLQAVSGSLKADANLEAVGKLLSSIEPLISKIRDVG